MGGDPNIVFQLGAWELGPDEALVIEVTPPVCAYWNFQLGNIWAECLDKRRRISVNHVTAAYEPDGSVRIVVAHRDPGHPNWIDTTGHDHGIMGMRWVRAETHPAATTRVDVFGGGPIGVVTTDGRLRSIEARAGHRSVGIRRRAARHRAAGPRSSGALCRARRAQARRRRAGGTTWRWSAPTSAATSSEAMADVDVAVFLVHSIGEGADWVERERALAENFRTAADTRRRRPHRLPRRPRRRRHRAQRRTSGVVTTSGEVLAGGPGRVAWSCAPR